MKKLLLLITLSALAVMMPAAVTAQVTTSTMSGSVTDRSGDALVGAIVLAIHTPSGASYNTTVDGTGNYRIANMRPGGPYEVTIQFLGYKTVQNRGIQLPLGDNYVLDARLDEQTMGIETIVVATDEVGANMRSDRAGAITNLTTRAITSAPTVSRSMNDLIRMTPQVSMSGNGANIGGANYRGSFVTVDGAAFNNAFGIGQNLPVNGSPISLDALEQISISLTPYDVRQSGFTGGAINAVTRSGDNEWRASAYTYFNNEKLKGNKVGDNTFIKNEASYNMYGIRLGGPIIKNKLFIFANYEYERSVEPGTTRVAATADKPYTDGTDGVARPTETQLNTLRDFLKENYGYDPGAYQNYSGKSPGSKLLVRVDWNINSNHKFNVRYSNTKSKASIAPSSSTSNLANPNFGGRGRGAATAMYFQNARYYQEYNFTSVAAELNSSFMQGRLNNMFRVSYSHQNEPRSYDGGEFPFVDIVEDGNTFTSFGTELFSYGNLRDVKTLNFTDEVGWSLGRHNFLAGIQYEHNNTKNGFQRFGTGYYQFGSLDDFYAAAAGDNTKIAQFAITHSYLDEGRTQAFPQFKFNQLSFYVQDDIRIGDRFNLIAGIRLEMPMYPSIDEYYNPEFAELEYKDGRKYSTSELPSTKVMFSPRVGFNYDIFGDRSLVLRGGTGIFTGRVPFVWIVGQASDSGMAQRSYTVKKGDAGKIIPGFTADRNEMLSEIYPGGIGNVSRLNSAVSLMDKELKMPQTWKTSLALDARLPWGMKGTLEAIYNKDVNPVMVKNVGLKDPVMSEVADYADNRYIYGYYYHYSTSKDVYLLTNADKGGYYYSLTAQLEKNFNRGFSAMVAYTYSQSKVYTDGVGDQLGSAWNTPATVNGNNSQELGYASYVMPHRLVGSVSYRKEYGKHFATSVSLFYQGGPRSRGSYTYSSNVVGDGGSNNLIYIPASKDELAFETYTVNGTDYTAAQQAEDFWNYIEQDKYLSKHKGEYMKRNGVVYPWVHTFDLKFAQDFYVDVAGKRNTIQLGVDIMNIGNLFNKNWGNAYTINNNRYSNSALLELVNSSVGSPEGTAVTTQPVYKFLRHGNNVRREAFSPTVGYDSTYSIQFSVRYIFN